jgi:hypothetical protein
MYNRLSHYMHTNNILVPQHFGFGKSLSTENAAFKLTNIVLKAINQKMHVGVIFCDLSKAFDYINHKILLAKLHCYGIQGTGENWFRSCLTNRKQKVQIKSSTATINLFSNLETVTYGDPQESVLGPLIFITYINDLPLTIKTLSEPVNFFLVK